MHRPIIPIINFIAIFSLLVLGCDSYNPKQHPRCSSMRSTAKSLHTAISDYYSDPSNTGLPTFQELNWSENIYRPRFKFEAELFRNSGDIIIVVTDPKNKCYKYKRLFMSAKYYWIKYETEDGVIEDDRRDSIISVAGDNSFDLQIFLDTKKPKYNYRSSRVR